MTENQKKIAIIIGTIIIAILLISSRSKAGTTIVNQQAAGTTPVITIPTVDLPRNGITVNVPGLPSFTPYQYSAISPCMCNGAAPVASPYAGPQVEFVTNLGGSGANIYNYAPPPSLPKYVMAN